jgi:hypothetical protein
MCEDKGWSLYVHDEKVYEVWKGKTLAHEQFLVLLCERGVPEEEFRDAVLARKQLCVKC